MGVELLFPFGINADSGELGVDLMTNLSAGIHLDKAKARALGWRGLRPHMGDSCSWTVRQVDKKGVYGLAFLGDEENGPDGLISTFGVFYFPDPEEAELLALYPAQAAAAAKEADYFAQVRKFTSWDAAELFGLALLRCGLDKQCRGLSLEMEVQTRIKVLALDGLPEQGVKPEELAWNIPALNLALPLFKLFTRTAETLTAEKPRLRHQPASYPLPAFDAAGEWGVLQGEQVPGVFLRAEFGSAEPDRLSGWRPLSSSAFQPKKISDEIFRPLLHVISGFLGSGKTTFLGQWLTWLHNHDRYTAVLQNELGKQNLDSSLLAHETLCEALDEGCVCCTLADSLRPALGRVMQNLPTDQIILETTGLANPGAVSDAIADLLDLVQPGLMISLVDALDMHRRLMANDDEAFSGLAGEQIRLAEVLVLNKCDLLDAELVPGLLSKLAELNPKAEIFPASEGYLPFGELDRLLDKREEKNVRKSPKAEKPAFASGAVLRPMPKRHITHQDEGYSSLLFRVKSALSLKEIRSIINLANADVPRIKGVIDLAGEKWPVILQYAAGVLNLDAPPMNPGPERFLVFIGKLDRNFIEALQALPVLEPSGP